MGITKWVALFHPFIHFALRARAGMSRDEPPLLSQVDDVVCLLRGQKVLHTKGVFFKRLSTASRSVGQRMRRLQCVRGESFTSTMPIAGSAEISCSVSFSGCGQRSLPSLMISNADLVTPPPSLPPASPSLPGSLMPMPSIPLQSSA